MARILETFDSGTSTGQWQSQQGGTGRQPFHRKCRKNLSVFYVDVLSMTLKLTRCLLNGSSVLYCCLDPTKILFCLCHWTGCLWVASPTPTVLYSMRFMAGYNINGAFLSNEVHERLMFLCALSDCTVADCIE